MENTKTMDKKALSVRMSPELHQSLNEFSKRRGVSANTYILDAIEQSMQIDSGLYDFNQPALERLNQLIDAIMGVSARLDVLADQVESQRQLFSQYMIGVNYLNQD